mgnify:CR=1 FL=1
MNEMDMDMDIMEIVDMMEEAIEKASAVPLTGKVMIDKGELLDYIQEIRLVYPERKQSGLRKKDKEFCQRLKTEPRLFRRMPKKLKCSLLTNTKLQRLHMNRLMSLLMPLSRSLSKLRLIQTNMLMTFLTTLNTDWTCYLEKFVRTEVISIITD